MPPKIKNPIAISIEQFLGNVLICGGSIIQIFTLVAWLIVQLQKAGVQVIVEDFRGFWRCLLNLSGDCAVFRSHEVPRNLLQPNGNRKEFASAITREIGKSCGMMPTTANACFSIIEGSYRSVRAGEPHLSFIEFQKKLRSLSQQWKNPKFDTAARSLEPLISLLGDCAYLKKAPDIFEQFGTIVFEHGRLPKQWYGLFAAHNYFSCQTL